MDADATKVKNVLIQYRQTIEMISDIERQIKELEREIGCIKGGAITGMPKGGQPITFVDKLADIEELVSRKLRFEKIAHQKKEIVQTYIDTVLSVKHNRVLTLYYIKRMSVYQIARREHYSDRYTFKLMKESLKMVDLSLNL